MTAKRPQLAGCAEILRSAQRDEEFLRHLKNLKNDLVQRFVGIPYWVKWKEFINVSSDFLYYSLTTLSGFQTLGEEYVNVIQVDKSLKNIPSKTKRIIDVFFKTVGYYVLLRIQSWLENHQVLSSDSVFECHPGSPLFKILPYLPVLLKSLTILLRMHLIAFYLNGSYYDFSKRLTGIKYVVIRRWLTNPAYQKPYKFLGLIAASQLCLSLIISLYSAHFNRKTCHSTKSNDQTSALNENATAQNQCSLCLEKRKYSTATSCGHLFCWSCITSWMQNKEECPLCREKIAPSKVLLLQNYY